MSQPQARLFDRGYVLALLPAVACGLWLYWPTLAGGLYAEDFLWWAMLDGAFAAERSPFDLADFAAGTPGDLAALQRQGSVPCWTPPDFRASFMRPLSSAMVHLDRWLFGDRYFLWHAHSLLAWLLLLLGAASLYRTLLPRGVAAASVFLRSIRQMLTPV